ncbi:hypothetical protein IV203_036142 [Nitzschia inconspicua]|uniref:c-Myc-binding protein n=1 Tax=Nitzschia inconspicua TaxID=303405 RepID=A0A9K3LFA9_9STRA|nr:hypothetical protein IV203_036142 [Nitzschia inconspicua]
MTTYAQQASSGKSNNVVLGSSGHGGNGGSHHLHHRSNSNISSNNNISSNSNSNNNNNSNELNKKEEFRKYLDQTGVLDSLTKALIGLYEEPQRPANAIEYVQRYMGAPPNIDVDGLRRENEQLKQEVERLRGMAGIKGKGSGAGSK